MNDTNLSTFLSNPYLSVLGVGLWKFMIVTAVAFLVFVYILWRKRKRQKRNLCDDDVWEALLLGMNFYAFLIALIFAFTGEFLFKDRISASAAMGIATLALFLYIKRKLKSA